MERGRRSNFRSREARVFNISWRERYPVVERNDDERMHNSVVYERLKIVGK